MQINIRKGIKKDLPQVLNLIKELAEYENALDEVDITLNDLEKDGFKERPYYFLLVAEKENEIIGLSFLWIRYSTWKGKFLFLEDFVIKKKFRSLGVGSRLFEETIKFCHDLELNGMIWQVLEWNTPAINFYKKYNANISDSWLNGKLSKKQITNIYSKLKEKNNI